jgi:hypothetical protein
MPPERIDELAGQNNLLQSRIDELLKQISTLLARIGELEGRSGKPSKTPTRRRQAYGYLEEVDAIGHPVRTQSQIGSCAKNVPDETATGGPAV